MATPLSFTPYLGWMDATDPNNIPADMHLIGAADLLRYENFGKDATTAINKNTADIETLNSALGTTNSNVSSATTKANNNASAISTLQSSVSTNTSDIADLKKNRTITTKTANYTVALTDSVIVGNGSAVTITLPSAVTATAGKVFTVKNINAANLTVASAAGTIDGAATKVLARWASATVISDGTNWLVL